MCVCVCACVCVSKIEGRKNDGGSVGRRLFVVSSSVLSTVLMSSSFVPPL